jgi:hypothetical protein
MPGVTGMELIDEEPVASEPIPPVSEKLSPRLIT